MWIYSFLVCILEAAGDGNFTSFLESIFLGSFFSDFSSVLTSLTFFICFLGLVALVSIKQTTCPTRTASPSSAFSVIIPLSSAGRSELTLSESTSAMV